jgi:hypothetical protein
MRRTLIRIAVPIVYSVLGVAIVYLGWPPHIVLTWETASEVDTAGFHVYRSPSPDGPFERVTDTPIPAQGDPLVGATYQHEDRNLAWGQRYYYQLEEVERSDNRIPFDEIVEGRAGAGWGWALGVAGLLAILGGAVGWYATRADGPQSAVGDE